MSKKYHNRERREYFFWIGTLALIFILPIIYSLLSRFMGVSEESILSVVSIALVIILADIIRGILFHCKIVIRNDEFNSAIEAACILSCWYRDKTWVSKLNESAADAIVTAEKVAKTQYNFALYEVKRSVICQFSEYEKLHYIARDFYAMDGEDMYLMAAFCRERMTDDQYKEYLDFKKSILIKAKATEKNAESEVSEFNQMISEKLFHNYSI